MSTSNASTIPNFEGPTAKGPFEIKDPWKHRSAGMRCQTCIWFVLKELATTTGKSSVGRCRRHAPTMGGYPVVFMTDWCGDHRLDENKA
jgi:hypothetical protein